MSLRVPVTLRAPGASDVPFITSAWHRSYRRGSVVRDVPDDVYHHHQQTLIQRLWRDRGVTWLLACHPRDTTFAYGFLCGEATDAGPVLHYLYVKGDDRKFGVGGEMLDSFMAGQPRDRAFYTHRTRVWDLMLTGSTRYPRDGWIYDPFLAWDGGWRRQ